MTRRKTSKGLRRTRPVAMILSAYLVASTTAMAQQGDGTEIEGRWQTAKKDLVLDIIRCAKGYCGQQVQADNRCDRTILTVAVATTSPGTPELSFAGNLAPPNALRANYMVRVSVVRETATQPASMVIVGDEVDPNPVRRTFPYRAVLARIGNATCRPGLTS